MDAKSKMLDEEYAAAAKEYAAAAKRRFHRRADIRPVTGAETATCLMRARARMNRNGDHWIKSGFFKMRTFFRGKSQREQQEPCYCAAGAIIAETPNDPALRYAAMRQLVGSIQGATYPEPSALDRALAGERMTLQALSARISGFIPVIFGWNDAPKRTWEEVDETFRSAAQAARKADRQKQKAAA